MDASMVKPLDLLRRTWSDTRGSSAVEMAFILPVLLLFLFGTFEFARFYYVRSQIEYAVELTVRWAYTNRPACTPENMQALVTDTSRLSGMAASAVTVTASVITNSGTNHTPAISPAPQSCRIDARLTTPFSFFRYIGLTTMGIQAIGEYPCRNVADTNDTCPTT
jgi:Flp pilus assembly protein TadG